MNWKLFRKIGGAALLVLGFLALLTPFTPGSWLIFIGAEILGIEMLSPNRLRGYYERLKKWWKGGGKHDIKGHEQEETP